MATSSSRLPTEHASRYLQQLCKHFGHRIPVTFTPEAGECRFSCGTARLRADENGLLIEIDAPDGERLAETQQVVESHLLRFAFKEEPGPLSWQDGAA